MIILDESILIDSERKGGLSDGKFFYAFWSIDDKVIIDNSFLIFAFFMIIFIGYSYNNILKGADLPQIWNIEFNLFYLVRNSNCILQWDSLKFSLIFLFDTEEGEGDDVVLKGKRPPDFWTIINFFSCAIVCPFF